jgi:hypothetical protein
VRPLTSGPAPPAGLGHRGGPAERRRAAAMDDWARGPVAALGTTLKSALALTKVDQ